MGFFDRFFNRQNTVNIDSINEQIISKYGGRKVVQEAYIDIGQNTSKKFKETLDINDQILEKYAKVNKYDIQAELMKKYLKLSQDDLNKFALEQEQNEKNVIDKEVEESLEGVDKDTKDKVKKDLIEEQKEQKQKGKLPDTKDKKKELQSRIYEATYKRMYKDYASNVMKIKNAQFESMAIGLGTKEAIEIIAMEKNLEKIDLLYHNHTGKDISQVEKIKNEKAEFKSEFDYNQKGIESNTDARARKINELYVRREEEYKKYIKALKDPTKSPYEKALYKQAYKEANLNLIQNIPSLAEYTKDLQIQGENEKLAKDAHLEEKTAINSRFEEKNNKIQTVTESKMAEKVYDVEETQKQRDARNFEQSRIEQRESLEKGDLSTAKKIGDAQRDKRVYDENIEKIPEQSTLSQTKKDVDKEEERSDSNFFASLRKVNNIEDKTPEELQNIIEDRNRDAEDKIKENAYKEQVEQKTEYQRYRKQNKRPNG